MFVSVRMDGIAQPCRYTTNQASQALKGL